MSFFFDIKDGDDLSIKIRLKEINKKANQWDHPMKSIFKVAKKIGELKDQRLLSKKDREAYCTALMALALMSETKIDWWISIPQEDPPDGLVGTFVEKNGLVTGMMREVEVVEYRNSSKELFELIKDKMTKKAYGSNTVLTCLVIEPESYDFTELAYKLSSINSSLKHVFLVFSGAMIGDINSGSFKAESTYTMVQLLPIYEFFSFDINSFMDDFNERYQRGHESRLIEGDEIYFGTANKKFVS